MAKNQEQPVAESRIAVKYQNATRYLSFKILTPRRVDQDWLCNYTIFWLGRAKSIDVGGVDSWQALSLAVGSVQIEIEVIQKKASLA